MQLTIDLATFANLSSSLFCSFLAVFLISVWLRQKNRLYTDLPLLFGVMFLSQALNSMVRLLPTFGIVESSLLLFRFRAIVIFGAVFPMGLLTLHIWFPRIRRMYSRLLGILTLYWIGVCVLVPSESLIMLLCIPVILVLDSVMTLTFCITWKTGRLKEVRSSLMVLGSVLGFLSQLFASTVILDAVLLALANGIITVAVVNPWFRRGLAASAKLMETSTNPMI